MATQHKVVDQIAEHSIPTTLDRAIFATQRTAGDAVTMASFPHARDFAGAAGSRWGGRD
jgi:hypothetical protein